MSEQAGMSLTTGFLTWLIFSGSQNGETAYKAHHAEHPQAPAASHAMHKYAIFFFSFRFFRKVDLLWATSWENLFLPYANNKGADQPVHPRSLISTFVLRYLGSIISILAISKNFKTLAFLCSWTGWFESYLVANLEDRFSRDVVLVINRCLLYLQREVYNHWVCPLQLLTQSRKTLWRISENLY